MYFIVAAAALAMSWQSCRKCDMDGDRPKIVSQTITASIAENSTYSYALPAPDSRSISEITGTAGHSSESFISTDVNGNKTYNYTPAANYYGTDVVVITTHGGCLPGGPNAGGHGNCNHGGGHPGGDRQTIITTINITITGSNAAVSKSATSARGVNF